MNKKIASGVVLLLLFIGFIYCVKTFDVAAIGPDGTEVGFSGINQTVHELTGVHWEWYDITDKLGYLAIGVAGIFAIAGLIQLIKRKSLFKVDHGILALGVLFIIVIGLYVGFEKVIINYRPVVMPGETAPEASFPSSHTMLIMTVMGAVSVLLGRYISNRPLRAILRTICWAMIILTVGGRLYCGVHWFTDIIGGLLISTALLLMFSGTVSRITEKETAAAAGSTTGTGTAHSTGAPSARNTRAGAAHAASDDAAARPAGTGAHAASDASAPRTSGSRRHYSKHASSERKPGFLGKFFKFTGILLLIIVLAVCGMLGYLSVTEFKPDDRMGADIIGKAEGTLKPGDDLRIVSWNIGYGALGENADFFMDGGKMVETADEDLVRSNMDGVESIISTLEPDIFFIQEVDQDSSRSHHFNELARLAQAFPGYTYSFANNFKVAFLPYPVPPIGKVDSGIATFSSYPVDDAARVQLPIPFSWPVRMANLKRCVLESRVPLKGTDRELVLMNLHLEAYDDGEGKAMQTEMLADLLKAEAAKGNYVIAGGDFNQIFSSADTNAYPAQEGKWQAGEIDVDKIDGDWQFLMDSSVPSCRSLDQPYAGANYQTFQYYLIDGFIVSGNIKVDKLENQDLGFVVSDHNPVLLDLKLKK